MPDSGVGVKHIVENRVVVVPFRAALEYILIPTVVERVFLQLARFQEVASSGRHSSTKSVETNAPDSTAVLIHIRCQLGELPVSEYGRP